MPFIRNSFYFYRYVAAQKLSNTAIKNVVLLLHNLNRCCSIVAIGYFNKVRTGG